MKAARLIITITLCLLVTAISATSSEQNIVPETRLDRDAYWSDQFGCPDLIYGIYSMTTYDGDLIIGGSLREVGGLQVNGVARWDGSSWSSLGEGLTDPPYVYGPVHALLEWDGLLIAGGDFTHSGATRMSCIAAWDGLSWNRLSSLPSQVNALAILNDTLYAGGEFGVKRWNPGWVSVMEQQAWSTAVSSLAVYDGQLYAGGKFTTIDGTPIAHIAVFDGTQWDAVGGGTDDDVYALHVYQDNLVVGGRFENAGGSPANYVAYWDGTSWGTMGDGTPGRAYEFHDFNGTLIAGCKNYEYPDDPSASVTVWTGTEWVVVEDGVTGIVQAMATYDNELIAIGDFELAGDIYNIGSWDGMAWEPLPTADLKGVDLNVNALTVWDGNLVAGGTFAQAGRQRCEGVALWDGSDWNALGEGFDNEVSCLVSYDGLLIAGARHYLEYDAPDVYQIGAWDGVSWQFIDSGLKALNVPAIYDFIEYDGKLVVAGGYFELFDTFIGHLAVWDGVGWSGMDIPSESFSRLMALGLHDGNLIVGGITRSTSLDSNHVFSWDGLTWTALGEGVYGEVLAIVTYRGELFIGGNIEAIGSVAINNVAKWNGSSWEQVGSGFDQEVTSLCTRNGSLIATGRFDSAGVSVTGVASWSGSMWSPLGSGLGGHGYDAVVYDTSLVVGGVFHTAGQEPSINIAFWSQPSSCCLGLTGNIDGDGNDTIDIADLIFLVNYMFQEGSVPPCLEETDINGDGSETPDINDLIHLVTYMFQDGPLPAQCP